MEVISLAHIHLRVNNMEKARSFFQDLTEVNFRPIFESEDLGVRSSSNQLGLVLLQTTDPYGKAGRMIELQEEGICALSLRVPNIDKAISEMESRGIKLIRKVEVGQVKEAWFESSKTFGAQIELCEFPGDDSLRVSK
ncbi:VOC family protein [Chloroflexota bacterium]